MDHVSELKSLRFILDESSTDGAECCMKVASDRKITIRFRPLVRAKSLQIGCRKVLHYGLLLSFLIY